MRARCNPASKRSCLTITSLSAHTKQVPLLRRAKAPFGSAEASPELRLVRSQHEVPPCANSFRNEDSGASSVPVVELGELAILTGDAFHH